MPDEKVVVEGKEIFNCRYALNDLKTMDQTSTLMIPIMFAPITPCVLNGLYSL